MAVFCTAVVLCAQPVAEPSQTVSDSVPTISLITCSPGQEVYELYGHTAIRVRLGQPGAGYDQVYNYGVFSFSQPHFVWRFVLGQCDYMVAACPFDIFLYEYRRRGSSVTEQVLNLKPEEAQRLSAALRDNARPENCSYRYNFLTNNCTTKARDIIEENINGNVIYPVRAPRFTYRQLIHQFTKGHPWAQDSNDMLLGVDMDTLVSPRAEMFLPSYLMNYADSAMIHAFPTRYRPLVSEKHVLLEANAEAIAAEAERQPSFPLTPAQLGGLLLALSVLLMAFEQRRGHAVWMADLCWMLLQGLAGILILIMVVWSTHPGVASNWQFVVFNPLPLLAIYFVVQADRHHTSCLYHRWAAWVLAAFLVVAPFIRQDFSTLVLFLASCLLTRALSHLLLYRQWKAQG